MARIPEGPRRGRDQGAPDALPGLGSGLGGRRDRRSPLPAVLAAGHSDEPAPRSDECTEEVPELHVREEEQTAHEEAEQHDAGRHRPERVCEAMTELEADAPPPCPQLGPPPPRPPPPPPGRGGGGGAIPHPHPAPPPASPRAGGPVGLAPGHEMEQPERG